MRDFLVCCDYGQGAIWLYVAAENAAELAERYPALTVFEEPPTWWTPELERNTRAKIGDPFWDRWLADLPKDPAPTPRRHR